jgi:transposase
MMGVSARAIVAALVEGRADPATMAELAKRQMRRKSPRLEQALTGLVRDHPRQWLGLQLAPIDCLDEPIEALSAEIMRRLAARRGDAPLAVSPGSTGEAGRGAAPDAASAPMIFAGAVTLLDTIPEVNQRGGERLVAAWGLDRGRVGTAARLAAWSGVAPGNDESAGTQRSGKTCQGHQAVRTGLTQWAPAAARTKGTSLSALAGRS